MRLVFLILLLTGCATSSIRLEDCTMTGERFSRKVPKGSFVIETEMHSCKVEWNLEGDIR